MRRSWAAVTVGILAVVIVGVSFGLVQYTREGLSSGEGYGLYALLRDAQGITLKSPVRTALMMSPPPPPK